MISEPTTEVFPAITDADAPTVQVQTEGQPAAERTERTERSAERSAERTDRDRGDRGDRGDRHRRDRGDRDRGGDRTRGERPNRDTEIAAFVPAEAAEVGTEAAPAVETEARTPDVEEVAARAIERADRGTADRGAPDRGGKGRRDKKAEPTAETREFWETWAEEKSTRPEPATEAPKDASAEAATETEAADGEGATERRPSRSRERGGRDRGRSRDKGEKRPASKTDAPADKAEKAEKADKPERGTRAKRDTASTPAPAMEGAQARLFVSLGKKHGVSADDLRALLAGPVGGDKERIGSVSLRDSHAHVRVPEDLVDAIIEGVNGTQHNEHDVTVERSRA